MKLLVVLCMLCSLCRLMKTIRLETNDNLKALGEEKLKELKQNALHNSCWAKAISKLNATCNSLSDAEQRRLALAFANCHLKESGRPTYPCADQSTLKDCTSHMSEEAFTTFTTFFTHTGHVCYFLQGELWQRRAETTITQLSDTSSAAVEKLEVALEYHREMEAKQDSALRVQGQILEQDRQIASSLKETGRSLTAIIGDVAEKAEKQKALLDDTLTTVQGSVDAVRYLMSLMMVEVVGVESVFFFLLAVGVVMLLPQYQHSRAKLFVVLFGEVCSEVLVRKAYTLADISAQGVITLHWVQWWCRYAGTAVAMVVYVREWWTYVDLLNHNSQLLSDIHCWVKHQQQHQHQLECQRGGQAQHQHQLECQRGGGQAQLYQGIGQVQPLCSHCQSPVTASAPVQFQKNTPQLEAYFRSLENVTPLVPQMSPPENVTPLVPQMSRLPDPALVPHAIPDNSHATPPRTIRKPKRDSSTTPAGRYTLGKDNTEVVEQEKEVLEEKEVAMTGEGQIYRDNRSCSPSLSRGRRVSTAPAQVLQPRYNLRSRTPAGESAQN